MMIRNFFFAIVLWGCAAVASFVITAFTLPVVFDWFEAWRGVPLPYEGAIRLSFLVVQLFLLAGSFLWLLKHGERWHWMTWGMLLVSFFSLLGIFVGDTTHRLMEEFSWIRYTTSGFLFLAGAMSGIMAWQYGKEGKAKRGIFVIVWALVGVAFVYAGLDEVLQTHEAIGRFMQQALSLPSFVTDLVTVTYALVTLLFLLVFFRSLVDEYRRSPWFMHLFVFGGVVYFFSTMFDTVDVLFVKKLRSLANVLSSDPSFIFGDAWYLLWSPRNFFNNLEEVFEHTAAALFFFAVFLLYLEKRGVVLSHAMRLIRWRRGIQWGVGVFFGVVVMLLFILSFPRTFPKSPIVGDVSMTRLAGYFDGLFHTDDLFFHPRFGVVVANEGKGNVYQWKDERWRQLPDVGKKLRDTDSVAGDENAIYISDGSQGMIFRTDGRGEWEALWSRKDGLKHPEGIVAVDGTWYVLDESEQSITKLVSGKNIEVWKPKHPFWRAPEGIAYHAKTGELLVTDDTTGALFALDFGKDIRVLARFERPEDVTVLPNGEILITDNGWGTVFSLTHDGKKEKIAQFLRSYRDLQGITVDEAGRMYVVTADGFDSTSFMPSFLFRIE